MHKDNFAVSLKNVSLTCRQLLKQTVLTADRKDIIKAQIALEYKLDRISIDKARKGFTDKEFKECLKNYSAVLHETLLNDLDRNLIEYSKQQVLKNQNNLSAET